MCCDFTVPVSIPQTFELSCQQAHEGGPYSAARHQVFSHQCREKVDVQRSAIQPATQDKQSLNYNFQYIAIQNYYVAQAASLCFL